MIEITCPIFTLGTGTNGLVLARFRSNHPNPGVTSINVPLEGASHFTQSLNYIADAAERYDISKSFCDVLNRAFNMIPITDNNNPVNDNKMAIMVTDCTLNLGANFRRLENELIDRDIKLYIVSTTTSIFQIRDSYDTLANRTGGEYMLLRDASVTLQEIILSTIHDRHIDHEVLQHMHSQSIVTAPNNPGDTNEQNQTKDGVGEMEFNL